MTTYTLAEFVPMTDLHDIYIEVTWNLAFHIKAFLSLRSMISHVSSG